MCLVVLATSPGDSKSNGSLSAYVTAMQTGCYHSLEHARLLVHLDYVARFMVNANRRIV
jgi:hypothetical protein